MTKRAALMEQVMRFLLRSDARTGEAAGQLYAHLVTHAPILPVGNMWLVSGWREITDLVADPRLLIGARAVEPAVQLTGSTLLDDLLCRMLTARDGADHLRLRRLLAGELSTRRAHAMAGLVDGLVDGLLTACLSRPQFDLVDDLGLPLPVLTSCAMLGLPRDDWHQVTAWARLVAAQIGRFGYAADQLAAVEREVTALVAYIERICALRRRHPGEGLLSRIVAGASGPEELTSLVLLLLVNGLETMTTAIANAVWTVLEWPGLLGRLDDPARAEAVFEEAIRLLSPVRLGSRRLAADLEYGGRKLRRGSTVLLLWAAANRDPERFPRPEEFRPGRPLGHMAFGKGAHHCLGAPLASVQGVAVLRALARRCPDLALAGEVTWRTDMAMQGPASLVVSPFAMVAGGRA